MSPSEKNSHVIGPTYFKRFLAALKLNPNDETFRGQFNVLYRKRRFLFSWKTGFAFFFYLLQKRDSSFSNTNKAMSKRVSRNVTSCFVALFISAYLLFSTPRQVVCHLLLEVSQFSQKTWHHDYITVFVLTVNYGTLSYRPPWGCEFDVYLGSFGFGCKTTNETSSCNPRCSSGELCCLKHWLLLFLRNP